LGGVERAAAAAAVRPDMKVLFMSGYTDSSAVHSTSPGGSVQFLQKPFTGLELAQRVREALGAPAPAPIAELRRATMDR
jgi:FixJ family two-component response regulator